MQSNDKTSLSTLLSTEKCFLNFCTQCFVVETVFGEILSVFYTFWKRCPAFFWRSTIDNWSITSSYLHDSVRCTVDYFFKTFLNSSVVFVGFFSRITNENRPRNEIIERVRVRTSFGEKTDRFVREQIKRTVLRRALYAQKKNIAANELLLAIVQQCTGMIQYWAYIILI